MRRNGALFISSPMEENARLELARKVITRTGTSLFLTGKAGTGKTTFLRQLRADCRKRMIVTAPTGIAAINAGGVTLHSFFQLDFGPYVPGMKRDSANKRSMAFSKQKIKLIRGMDLLVIDEVSMVRADLLDAVDDVLRRFRDRNLPFGGVQLLLIGDLRQLPPVVVQEERPLMEANYRSPYFFDSHALKDLDYLTLELSKIYRQSDREFIDMLNAVRTNRVNPEILARLNRQYRKDFNPKDSEGYVRLTTHNSMAARINRERMDRLRKPTHYFDAAVEGNFPETSFPADRRLELKEGAQVMFIKNDSGADRRFFNGMMGTVTSIDGEDVMVTPTDSDEQIKVEPVEWENVKFVIDAETNEITEQREGVFRQLPLRPAWAITIHKSQGLTFDKAIINASAAFTSGQTYVALSRCRSLDGLVLESPLTQSSVITDATVTDFLNAHSSVPDNDTVDRMAHYYELSLVEGIFNFRPLFNVIEGVTRMLKENFMRLYPNAVAEFEGEVNRLRPEMIDVGIRFCNQLRRIDSENPDLKTNTLLLQRIKDACNYFYPRLEALTMALKRVPGSHDNKTVTQKLNERTELYAEMADVRKELLTAFRSDNFDLDRYLDIKARGSFKHSDRPGRRSNRADTVLRSKQDSPGNSTGSDVMNPVLLNRLLSWRKKEANARGTGEHAVVSLKILMNVADALPRNEVELLLIPGVGKATAKKIGDDLIRIVTEYMNEASATISVPRKLNRKS